MRMQMRIAYISVFGIPRADVDISDSLTKTPCRSACKMVYCIGFPVYA